MRLFFSREHKEPRPDLFRSLWPSGMSSGERLGFVWQEDIKWRKQAATHTNAHKGILEITLPVCTWSNHVISWLKSLKYRHLIQTLTFSGRVKSSGRKSSGTSRTISCLRMHHSFLAATDTLISRLQTWTLWGAKLGMLKERWPGCGFKPLGGRLTTNSKG